MERLKKFKKALSFLPAVPIFILLRILEPFFLCRFLSVNIGRIGGIRELDWYLSARKLFKLNKKTIDIFYLIASSERICNHTWKKLWKRTGSLAPLSWLWYRVDYLNKKFSPNKKTNSIPMLNVAKLLKTKDEKQMLWEILRNKKPWISFTSKEEKIGKKKLEQMGIALDKEFICFHARDKAYLDKIHPSRDWSYHDYRNSNIQNYFLAMQWMSQQGYYAIRTGAIVSDKLNLTYPKIIDYATNGMRNEFMDIYLGAKCWFYLCSDVGISMIPEMFRRPLVYVNWTPISRLSTFVHHALFIPKKFFSKDKQKYLTFREIIESGIGSLLSGETLQQRNIELIENTPEEILSVVEEMTGRLNGTWIESQEEKSLQEKFWAIYGNRILKTLDFRIGAVYLRENQNLLL